MPKFIDLTGQKFGRLVVLRFISKNNRYHKYWLCRCDCNKKKIIREDSLRSGNTQSCGCLFREGNNIKHGHSKNEETSETYTSWANMIRRCTNPKHKSYKNYGGRRITVCKRWRSSFENFLEDMGEVPCGHQIDRINNNGNYCKSNCRWVTRKQQMRNRRNNHLETFNNKTQCLSAWAEQTGISAYVIESRLKRGWSIEKTLTTPVKKRRK